MSYAKSHGRCESLNYASKSDPPDKCWGARSHEGPHWTFANGVRITWPKLTPIDMATAPQSK